MLNQFSRTELLLGKEAMNKLENSRVAVFGIGGVGGYVCEALVRSGVGTFDLIMGTIWAGLDKILPLDLMTYEAVYWFNWGITWLFKIGRASCRERV